MEQETKELLQWHPAFYASLQIELAEEADKLIIDVLIIKKNSKEPIQKNIGKIFKGHNIIEYKSPTDSLSIDDFYKVYGYTCFYKSDANQVNAISIEDLTITFASHKYPREMIRHLSEVQGYEIVQQEAGIYYIVGDILPIQLLVTSKLSKEQNLWLKSLTNNLKQKEQIEAILADYEKHRSNHLYDAVMNLIVKANQENFKEVSSMCEALEALMEDKIQERVQERVQKAVQEAVQEAVQKAVQETVQKAVQEAEQRAEQRGIQLGKQQGEQQGEQRGEQRGERKKLLQLIQKKMQKNKTIEQIAEELEETIETIAPLYYQLKENN